ncbi:MAG: hypothetical protein LAO30_22685 [Acidobacteriia bacterium]|nr:hypothetical protein [Terriglobia bacterium]
MSKKNMGSNIDDFLKRENIYAEAQAIKEVVAWQLAKVMKKKISKTLVLLRRIGTHVRTKTNPMRSNSVESHPCAQNAQGWGTRRKGCRGPSTPQGLHFVKSLLRSG